MDIHIPQIRCNLKWLFGWRAEEPLTAIGQPSSPPGHQKNDERFDVNEQELLERR